MSPSFRPGPGRLAGRFRRGTGSWPGPAAMTVVVEGTLSSGSLITAGFAQDLGRDLGAVPGQVTSALGAGPNDLIHRGRIRRAVCRGHARRPLRAGGGPVSGLRRSSRVSRRCWKRSSAVRAHPMRLPRARPKRRGARGPFRARAAGTDSPLCGRALRSLRLRRAGARICSFPMSTGPHTEGALDRGIGLRRRRRDPGRPEGVRALGVYGMTAITAVTWQNTVAVEGVTPIPPEAIVGQVRAVAEDIGVDAVKIGMLGTLEDDLRR